MINLSTTGRIERKSFILATRLLSLRFLDVSPRQCGQSWNVFTIMQFSFCLEEEWLFERMKG